MTDRVGSAKASSSIHLASSAVSTASQGTLSSAIRPRHRDPDSFEHGNKPTEAVDYAARGGGLFASQSTTNTSRSVLQTAKQSRAEHSFPKNTKGGHDIADFLGDSWNQGWSSVQTFASNLMSANGNQSRNTIKQKSKPSNGNSQPGAWGPNPPNTSPAIRDVAAGSLARRETALKAAKTARILESHDGVNGGLDTTGKHKRRTSEEVVTGNSLPEDHLVYVHEVQPHDTYAGIILRYRCREDIFRKSNGLWSRDSIQMRKQLIIPVDACEVRGRLCDPPASHKERGKNSLVKDVSTAIERSSDGQNSRDDYFNCHNPTADSLNAQGQQNQECEKPWTHVRWVQIDSFKDPIQIVRVARQALGFFPPRRKKSSRSTSPVSTPRQSLDFSSLPQSSAERSFTRRPSLLSGVHQVSSSPSSSRSQIGEDLDHRPAWMRRPGGVGSMSSKVKVPGPDQDYFNTWTKKHIPGLNIESLPSMAIMGSESAHFGFEPGPTNIVESPLGQGMDAVATSAQGSGLDRAAAAVEHWLRGALAKRPGTPLLESRMKPLGISPDQDISDLIELADAGSDDDKPPHPAISNFLASSPSSNIGRVDSPAKHRNTRRLHSGNRELHRKHD